MSPNLRTPSCPWPTCSAGEISTCSQYWAGVFHITVYMLSGQAHIAWCIHLGTPGNLRTSPALPICPCITLDTWQHLSLLMHTKEIKCTSWSRAILSLSFHDSHLYLAWGLSPLSLKTSILQFVCIDKGRPQFMNICKLNYVVTSPSKDVSLTSSTLQTWEYSQEKGTPIWW